MRAKSSVHHSHKHKNLLMIFMGVIVAVVLSRDETFRSFLLQLGSFGYFGGFLAGVLFVSTLTVATGAVILLLLAQQYHPLELGLVAGLGAVVGDLIILRFVKDSLASEIEEIYNHLDRRHHLKKLFHSQYFSWMLPVLGAIIIASPLPDELGVSLMGISQMKTPRFILISFLLNSLGIFIVVSTATLIKS